ncbi:MAG: prepilin-type N-terminal cleavage/methylation domain-containing protein [Candidatus Sumerlaeia bacterium]|nr:prepilin-type N-terminal cleavage/methylation domain-containing protein [Candidatus Sumerlaeia bacterium]
MQLSLRKAFTLIELLIVVAIIAILAAIAVPNFLEAQTRSKISRVKSDMRTLATGIESYYVDNNYYPKGTDDQWSVRDPDDVTTLSGNTTAAAVLERLSTPISYLTSGALQDPFTSFSRVRPSKTTGAGFTQETPITGVDQELARYYKYTAFTPGQGAFVSALVTRPETTAKWAWGTWSPGPEGKYVQLRGSNLLASAPFGAPEIGAILDWAYDPTNGTASRGNIWRTGGIRTGEGAAGDIWLTTMLPVTSR